MRCGTITPGGILVTLSSWAAQRGPGNPALIAYAASKGAVLSATKAIARNYAKNNILAFGVAPGVVRTRLSEQASAATGGEAAVTATLAMGEWVPPSDLGSLIVFLSSGACRHLSGAPSTSMARPISAECCQRSARGTALEIEAVIFRQDRIGVSILSASAA